MDNKNKKGQINFIKYQHNLIKNINANPNLDKTNIDLNIINSIIDHIFKAKYIKTNQHILILMKPYLCF